MEEREYYIALYEYYKNLLTDKQNNYFNDYYYDNLTMEEISENNNISKNAISKQIIIIKNKLDYYEKNLQLYNNRKQIKKIINNEEVLNLINNYI